MIPLAHTTAFKVWVANTVLAVSGIKSQQPSHDLGECALTCEISRAAACQGVCNAFFEDQYQAFMRPICEVVTNKPLDIKKLH